MKKLGFKKWSKRLTAWALTVFMLITAVPIYAFSLENKDHTADPHIVRDMNISYQNKGETEYTLLEAPYKINDITKVQSFRVVHSFILDDLVGENGEDVRSVSEGDYYLIDLPEKLIVSNSEERPVLDKFGKEIAKYSFVEKEPTQWQIKIEFTSYVDDPGKSEIYGAVEFDFMLDLDAIEDGKTEQIYIPIDDGNGITLEVTKPVPPSTKPLSLTKTVAKTYNNQTRELVWNVTILPETGIFAGCVFTDTIDVENTILKSIRHGNVSLKEGENYTYDPDTGKITYTIPVGRNGKDFQDIEITTAVKTDVYGGLLPTTISNTANLSGGADEVDIDSNTATQTVTPDWLNKSGSVVEGNKIQWTLKANSTNQSMYNAVITDHLQGDVQLDKNSLKLGTTSISIYDDSYTPADDSEVYAVYIPQGSGTADLVIYLPRGQENASTDTQVITFVTNLTAPPDATSNPVYNNTASMTVDYIGDGDTPGTIPEFDLDQVGVGVPHVSVDKGHQTLTAEDKSNGTITWTIDASSNLSRYGKSVLTDTLPEDQDFIADEIYLGTEKIDETTNPKAEISANGRTLTITFEDDNALETQQHLTVKTKIKTEVYGQNISRDFKNEISCILFDETDTNEVATDTDSDKVDVRNTVISKASSVYKENSSGESENPKVNFTITINKNRMPLANVVVKDDLSKIITEFKKSGGSFERVADANWSLIPDTLKIKRVGGKDTFDLDAVIADAKAGYSNSLLTVDFGKGVSVSDEYAITFTVELDASKNEIFKENGTFRCRNNIASIEGDNLKTGVITSSATGNTPEIKNEVLGKSGTHMVKEQQALWTINLNQRGITLGSTKVIDVLPAGLTLDPTSVKLYTKVIGSDGNFLAADKIAEKGQEITQFDYTYLPATMEGFEGRYVLTVTLPDDTNEYTLQFATDIDRKLLGKPISNGAYYAGTDGTPKNENTSNFTLSNAAGGGSTTKSSITVNKKSNDNGANLDATFALHWLKGGTEPVLVRSLSTNNGTVTFYGLTLGEKYTVTEITAPNGYIIDDPAPKAFVVPTDASKAVPPLTFYNSPVKTGSWTPAAVKKLDGKDILHTFQFTLNSGGKTVMNGVTKTALAGGSYTVDFSLTGGALAKDVLDFTDSHIFGKDDADGTAYLAATRIFTMKETPLSLPGYGFDKKEVTLVVKAYNVKGRASLKVVIEDENGNVLSDDDGKLKEANIPAFENTYRASGGIQLSAEKSVVGHALAADQFSFELYEENNLLKTAKNGDGILTGDKTYTGNVFFDEISYTQSDVGTKVYRIVEKNTALSGYTYDTAEYSVTVLVSDNDDGTLTSVIQNITKKQNGETAADKVSFTNTYTTTGTDTSLTAVKKLNGRTLADGQFSFKLNEVTADGTFIKELATVSNQSGKVAFPKLSYKQSDIGATYYYQILEVDDKKAGYTYDSSVFTAKVLIVDNDNGTITAKQTFLKDGLQMDSIGFANTYKATGSTTIAGKKELTGKKLPEDQFAFTLQQVDGTTQDPIGEKTTVRNKADGEFVFPTLTYTEADAGNTYFYQITEVNDAAGGYTYDDTVYTVKVQVADNGNGTLELAQSIVAPTDSNEILFSNTYTVADTSAAFTAQKILDGRVLEEGQFTFLLNQVKEDGTLLKEIERVTNGQEGLISFKPVIYTQADMGNTYYYQISEAQAGNPGYGYDATIYTIKVEVVDNGDGTLKTVKTISRDNTTVTSMVFTNTYTTTDTSAAFTAQKILDGRVLEEGQFTFSLNQVKEDGTLIKEIQKVTNGADGLVSFDTIRYTQADMGNTYYYQVSEVKAANPGYSYDSTVYDVKVEVIDNGDGTLKTVKTISRDGTLVTSMVFTNSYVTTNATLALSAEKELLGRKLEDGQFTFRLSKKGDNGAPDTLVEEVTNKADGSIRFTPMTFTQEDMGKTYVYTISEESGEKSGYTYDKTVYEVTVKVIDNGDGTLRAQAEITKSADESVTEIKFVNSYRSEEGMPPNTGDTTPIMPFAVTAVLSLTFTLISLKKRKNMIQKKR